MTSFISKIKIDKPVEQVYLFLEDCNNHEKLQPENIYNWTSTRDEAHFTIQNMAKLSLVVKERIANQSIEFVPSGNAPFDLFLKWMLSRDTDGSSNVILELSADLNMMMKMMASGPLQKLVDYQTAKLAEVL
ncbi:SRPBCC family protein [Albibacterium profundi]|uniref:SRPBCC family protein n=1 Tax=Albibacterium profundi TaxID=3134906 RepID=A0ABV5CH33_9SPHI